MANTVMIVATHKKYRMPTDSMYLPVQAGCNDANCIGYQGDNEGVNISYKNAGYSELTALYWAWKNLDFDYLGLVHYRRHFTAKRVFFANIDEKFDYLLTAEALEKLLLDYDVLVPVKRKYYIETLYSHYAHTFHKEHLDITLEVIKDLYPEYAASADKVMNQTFGYMFNLMIMKKEYINNYCTWLFDVLEAVEAKLGEPVNLSAFEMRICARLSELLLNVWLSYQINNGYIKKSRVHELPYVYTGKIQWIKKIVSFLKAKFAGVKYTESF